jgi:hypothetical protein
MIAFAKYSKLGVMGLVMMTICAQGAQAPVPKHIDVKRMSKEVQNVVVPLPNEIFGALNKLGSVNWHEYVRTNKGTNFTEPPRIALLLGAVIADGFIAVQAQDAPAVKEIGQRVQTLARGIGVERSITAHAKAIIDYANRKKWENVRQELDRTQSSVQQAMNELHDEKLSQLVSLGGWLRGTQVLTAVVRKNFTADGAELLHQPDLLTHFQSELNGMPEYNLPIIHQIRSALVEVKPLIGGRQISPAAVRKVNDITTHLDNRIVTKD